MKLTNSKTTFERPSRDRHGMDVPLWASEIESQETMATIRIALRFNDWAIEVSPIGMYLLDKDENVLARDVYSESDANKYRHGWNPVEAVCEQTGGMTMVDYITLDNGLMLSIGDEAVSLLEPDYDPSEESPEGREVTGFWFPYLDQ